MTTVWLEEKMENSPVHDSIGNVYPISSTWVRDEESPQRCVREIHVVGKGVYRHATEIEDGVLRKQVKKSIAYGKGRIVEVKRL